jgi:hypothetical protein
MPDTLETPAPKMVENGLPARKVRWEVAPGAAGSQDVKDRITNFSQGVGSRSATRGLGGEMLLQVLPLSIGKVAWIDGTHTSQCIRFCPSLHSQTRSKRRGTPAGRAG